MCCGTTSVTIPASQTAANSDNAGTFPATFISSPSVVLTGNRSEINRITNRFVSPSRMAIRVGIENAMDEAFSATISFFAIGKWK